jgi:hypothetical protein
MYEKLTDKNFLLYCASHYDNAQYASTEDFVEDLNSLKYIKKGLTYFICGFNFKYSILHKASGPKQLLRTMM